MTLRQFRLILFLSALALSLDSSSAFGCSCPKPPSGSTVQQLAEWRNQGIEAIFEGTVEDANIKSLLLDAPVGSAVPANLEESSPVISVTFSDTHFYKGVKRQTVQIETGLGGGDCGFRFELKRRYLVYAYKEENGRLSTGICTATAPIEESTANLAYLRRERVAPDGPRTAHRPRNAKLCGRLIADAQHGPDDDAKVMFLRNGSTSPVPYEEAEPDENGNFCAYLDPGEYRLIFTNTGEEPVTSYVYYPGTMEASDAAEITLNSGEGISDLTFRIPVQETFSVSGVVSSSYNSKVPDNMKVILLSADRPFQGPAYGQDIASDGTFRLPRVLPGKYWALLDIDSNGNSANAKWSTIKTEVLVNGNVDHIALQLIRN
jgi:hypothetical protein